MVSAPTPPSGRRIVREAACAACDDEAREKVTAVDVVFVASALANLPTLLWHLGRE